MKYYSQNLFLGNIFNFITVERKIWKRLIKTDRKWHLRVKNHVVFIKTFRHYCKMSESADHDISVFVWRIYVTKYSRMDQVKFVEDSF